MFKNQLVAATSVFAFAWPSCSLGECMAVAFRVGEEPKNPIYQVKSCQPAKEVVDRLKASNASWYGDIQYLDTDVAVEVTAANEDAERYLGKGGAEYWYFAEGCSVLPNGRLLELNRLMLKSQCCDIGPVRTVRCALGGKELLGFWR